MGGMVAFEIAQQFYEQGQEIALLALIEAGDTGGEYEEEEDATLLVAVFGKDLPLSVKELRQLGSDEQLVYVIEKAKEYGKLPPGLGLDQARRLRNVFKANLDMLRRYMPSKYNGRVVLFRSSESITEVKCPDLGWGQIANGGVEIYIVPGNHLTMCREPHVRVLAEKLRACLDSLPIFSRDK